MKLRTKAAVVGCFFGAVFSLFSLARYFVLYPDTDKAIVYGLVGMLIIGFSYLYEEVMKNKDTLENLEEYIVDKEDKNVWK